MMLLNAQLSKRSMQRWERFGLWFLKMFFRGVTQCLTIHQEDVATFLRRLVPCPVDVVGSLKWTFDPELSDTEKEQLPQLQEAFGERPLWVAVSTHPGEDSVILEAHQRLRQSIRLLSKPSMGRGFLGRLDRGAGVYPDIHEDAEGESNDKISPQAQLRKKSIQSPLLVLIPRHTNRAHDISKKAAKMGFSIRRFGDPKPFRCTEDIFMVGAMGVTKLFYSLSKLVFVAGSLRPHIGGHNLIEVAPFGATILTGPYMEKNQETQYLFTKHGALKTVSSVPELANTLLYFMQNPEDQKLYAERAKALYRRYHQETLKIYVKALLEKPPHA
jgi:3-deoxy-D-manno-octulosonic-acid transferase